MEFKKRRKKIICGSVVAISLIFRLKVGLTGLIDLKVDENSFVCILLIGPALLIHCKVNVGDRVEITDPKVFKWKSIDFDYRNSYLVDSVASINLQHGGDKDFLIHRRISNASYFKPTSIPLRDYFANNEVDVPCQIVAIHIHGWILISLSGMNSRDAFLFIYVPHRVKSFSKKLLYPGNDVILYNGLPIYLWGKLRGFACTARSNIVSLVDSIEESRQRYQETGSINSSEHSLESVFNPPEEIAKSCHYYCAFRADVYQRLCEGIIGIHSMDGKTLRRITEVVESLAALECGAEGYRSHPTESVIFSDTDSGDSRTAVRDMASLNKGSGREFTILDEFFNVRYASFYAVRGCHDWDFISVRLPYVLTVNSVMKTVRGIMIQHVRVNGLHALRKFNTHMISLLSVNDLGLIEVTSSQREKDGLNISPSPSVNSILLGSLLSWRLINYYSDICCCSCILGDSTGNRLKVLVMNCPMNILTQTVNLLKGCSLGDLTSTSYQTPPESSSDILSQLPIAVIHHPTLLAEEDPSAKDFMMLTIVTDMKNVRIITEQASTASANCELCPDSASVKAGQRDNDLHVHVREILSISKSSVILSSFVQNLVGVVVAKDLTRENKVCLTLRDLKYPDSVLIYVANTAAGHILVGMHVKILSSKLRISSGRRKSFYLEFVPEIKHPSRGLDVIGMSIHSHYYQTRNESRSIERNLVDEDSEFTSPPPRIYVIDLLSQIKDSMKGLTSRTCQDRIFWTLIGRVCLVNELSASLRCKECFHPLRGGGSFPCESKRCQYAAGRDTLSPPSPCNSRTKTAVIAWELTVEIDDGTSQILVNFEGEKAVRTFLRECTPLQPPRHHNTDDLLSRISTRVIEVGNFSVRPLSSSSSSSSGSNINIMDGDGKEDISLRSTVCTGDLLPETGREALTLEVSEWLLNWKRSLPWQVTVRRSLWQEGHLQKSATPVLLKLQEVNLHAPHQVRFSPAPVAEGLLMGLLFGGFSLIPFTNGERNRRRGKIFSFSEKAWELFADLNDI